MLAFKKARGFVHCGFVKGPRIVQRATTIEWRQNRAAINAVAVSFSLRLPARMKILADFFGGHDADRCRKQRIQRALNFVGGQRGMRPEMRYLA